MIYLTYAMGSGRNYPFLMHHRWELPGNYPVLTVVMVIYHYVERIWGIIVTPDFCITYTTMKNIIQLNQLIYI